MTEYKEPIHLRRRKTSTGNISLYLDIYLNGHREYEYLKLYLVPEATKADRDKNRQTLQLAEAIKAKRIVELQNGEFGFKHASKDNTLFYEYFESICEKRIGETKGNWRSALKQLQEYCPNRKLTFKEVTPQWLEGFKEFLDKKATCWRGYMGLVHTTRKLKANSKQIYFNKVRACLNQAYEEGVIHNNPLRCVDGIRGEEVHRMYLTIEELKNLAATPCKHAVLKRGFLFSCLTGLRRSDIQKMVWSEVQQHGEFTRIVFKQKKTGGVEYLDITAEAAELLGERGDPDALVFDDILSVCISNSALRVWAAAAGIDKELTFHCGRHTFATLMLDLGTDIYTVSKLLGHKDISTTQIYAKIMDKNKQAAVAKIPRIIDPDK